MSEYQVIYDPDAEVAAIVDLENRVGYGPAAIGPDAREQLEAFMSTIPYDFSELSSYGLRSWFEQFLPAFQSASANQPAATVDGAVESQTSATDSAAALAQREAVAAGGEPPAPQPADTDAPQDAGETAATVEPPAYEGPCMVCNGTGAIAGVDGGAQVMCNLCHGTGHLPVPVTA